MKFPLLATAGLLGTPLSAADSAESYKKEIVPLYYQERASDGLPGEWIARMKESIRTLAPQFGTRRMVKEYVEKFYAPALKK